MGATSLDSAAVAVLVVRLLLASILLWAALLKLASPVQSREALATFGVRGPHVRRAVWSLVVATEVALAVGVAVGWAPAAYTGAVMALGLAAALGLALRAGQGGRPCGCFGPASRVSAVSVARNLGLAATLALLPALPTSSPSSEDWLAVGVVIALVVIAALVVSVLALARQVGELRAGVGPDSALEILDEGPELGGQSALIEEFSPSGDERVAVAVFVSDGCPACGSLAPALAILERDPLVRLRSFEERLDPAAWEALDVPGAPYAVALGPDGTVLAKGAVNTLPQLDSVVATAKRRRGHPAVA